MRRGRIVWSGVVFAGLVLAGGCRRSDGTDGGFAVRDSAGVRIAESRTPARPDDVPALADILLDIGGEDDPAQQLYDVGGIARLRDGGIVIADNGSRQLRFHDAAGRLVRAVGGDGEGPGEYRALGLVHVMADDSIVVWDPALARLSVLAPDGAFARTLRLREDRAPGVGAIAVLPDRTVLARGGFSFGPDTEHGAHRPSQTWHRFDLDGRWLGSVGTLPAGDHYVYNQAGTTMAGPLPFGRSTSVAPWRAGFAVATGDASQVAAYDAGGAATAVLRRPVPRTDLTDADIDAFRGGIAEEPDDNDRRFFERRVAALPFPDSLPATGRVVPTADGGIWVEQPRADSDAPARWQVFDSDGRWLGTVETPARLEVRQIGADWLAGTETDDLDVERVRVYRLRTPR